MAKATQNRLGIIAGAGDLPVVLSKSTPNALVAGIDGFCDPSHYEIDCEIFSLAKVGAIIAFFKQGGVTDIIIAGGIKRPALSTLLPDALGAKLITRIALKSGGDDKTLRIVVEFLENQGFAVKSVEDVLGCQSLEKGVFTDTQPNQIHLKDIARGKDILENTSDLDIGQATLIQEGLVLSVEAIEGTDAMIRRSEKLMRDGNTPVLIKMIKTNQSRDVDLPTIGIDTIKNLHAIGAGGIAVSAGGIIILDKQAVIDTANALGLFIVAI